MPAVLAILLAIAAAPAPTTDPLTARLLAESRSITETSFGWERVSRAEGTDGRKVETEVDVDRYDPTATPRYRLLTVDGKPPKADKLREYVKAIEKKPAPNYGRVAILLVAARRVDATHYHVDELPKGIITGQGAMMAKHLVADLIVDTSGSKPFVSETRMFAPTPFRMMLIAKVDKFEVLNRYRPGPDGRPRIVEQDVTIAGSWPGQSGTQITRATFRPL